MFEKIMQAILIATCVPCVVLVYAIVYYILVEVGLIGG